MIVSTTKNNNNICINLEGELDQSVASKLRTQLDDYLLNTQAKNVIFNLDKLKFMDSTGIGLIMGRYKKLNAKKIAVFITNPNKQIDKVLTISGIYKIIPKI
ncbi:MAG: STAS domain-containing protein [Clostridia bacterium]